MPVAVDRRTRPTDSTLTRPSGSDNVFQPFSTSYATNVIPLATVVLS